MTRVEYVKLTPEQVARRDAASAQWVATLQAQARNETDPETRDAARAVLARRGMGWQA